MTLEIKTLTVSVRWRKVEQITRSSENSSECESVERCPVRFTGPLQLNVLLHVKNNAVTVYLLYRFNDRNEFRCYPVMFFFSLFLTSVTLTLCSRLCGVSVLFLRHRTTAYKGLHDELMISPETTNLLGFWKYCSLFIALLNACHLRGGVAWTSSCLVLLDGPSFFSCRYTEI